MLLIVIAFIFAAFLWRWLTLFALVYIAFFPFIVLLWKAPAFVIKRRSWLLAMVVFNTLAIFLRDLRYNVLSKSIAIVTPTFLIFVTGPQFVLILQPA